MMTFLDYYLSPVSRWISAFFGLISGVAVGLFTGWQYGVLAGGAVALLASVIVPLRAYIEERPYNRIRATLQVPILLDHRVRFSIRGGTVGGYFILTPERMIFLSMERGEHRLEFSHSDVTSVIVGNDMTLRVFLNDRQFVRMISNKIDEISDVLRENGWRVHMETSTSED